MPKIVDQTILDAHLEDIRIHTGGAALISLTAAAKYLGVDPRTLQADRTFPIKRIGGRYHVSAVALAGWLTKS